MHLNYWKSKTFLLLCSKVILSDLSKAFGSIKHSILLSKLEKPFGLRRNPLKLQKSYLTNKVQCIKISNSRSKQLKTDCGVPHESLLDPLLFISMYMTFFQFLNFPPRSLLTILLYPYQIKV